MLVALACASPAGNCVTRRVASGKSVSATDRNNSGQNRIARLAPVNLWPTTPPPADQYEPIVAKYFRANCSAVTFVGHLQSKICRCLWIGFAPLRNNIAERVLLAEPSGSFCAQLTALCTSVLASCIAIAVIAFSCAFPGRHVRDVLRRRRGVRLHPGRENIADGIFLRIARRQSLRPGERGANIGHAPLARDVADRLIASGTGRQ